MNKKLLAYFLGRGFITLQDGILVRVPIIYTEEVGGRRIVVLRWYGAKEEEQFDFRLTISEEQIFEQLAANPYHFRPAFIGQLRDFPRDNEFYEQIVDNFRGELERFVLFAVAPIGLRVGEDGIVVPFNFSTEIILLADSGKVISPRPYLRLEEWGEACEKLNPRTQDEVEEGGLVVGIS